VNCKLWDVRPRSCSTLVLFVSRLLLRRTSFLTADLAMVNRPERRDKPGHEGQSRLCPGVTSSGCFCGMYWPKRFRRVRDFGILHGHLQAGLIHWCNSFSGCRPDPAKGSEPKSPPILCHVCRGVMEHHRVCGWRNMGTTIVFEPIQGKRPLEDQSRDRPYSLIQGRSLCRELGLPVRCAPVY